MENVLLIIHLILALFLIAVVLLQRSEGGGLGIGGGGGGGGGGMMSSRSAGTALTKATWGIAGAFLVTSLSLTILATQKAGERSVIDRLGVEATTEAPATDGVLDEDLEGLLTPPPAQDPTAPPAAE